MKFRCALFLSVAILSAHTAPALTVINRADSGAGSLRQVIIDAPRGETITFANTLDSQTITLTSGQRLIDKDLDIDALDLTGGITIDGNANGRIFQVSGNNTTVFESLTLTNGLAPIVNLRSRCLP